MFDTLICVLVLIRHCFLFIILISEQTVFDQTSLLGKYLILLVRLANNVTLIAYKYLWKIRIRRIWRIWLHPTWSDFMVAHLSSFIKSKQQFTFHSDEPRRIVNWMLPFVRCLFSEQIDSLPKIICLFEKCKRSNKYEKSKLMFWLVIKS